LGQGAPADAEIVDDRDCSAGTNTQLNGRCFGWQWSWRGR
jgi:hypothetical protein